MQIDSINNVVIKEASSLLDKKSRISSKRFLIEGAHLVDEAYMNHHLLQVFSTDEAILKKYPDVPGYIVSEKIIKKLSNTVTPQNIIGVSKMIDEANLLNILAQSSYHILILEDVKDPGNLGTLIRTSAALGYDAIIMSPECADLYNDKVVRSTQGTIYHINIIKADLLDVIEQIKLKGGMVIGTSLKKAVPLNKVEVSNRVAIIIGNEAHGMSAQIESKTSCNVIIPMKNNVESLNAAIAGGIVMYELIK